MIWNVLYILLIAVLGSCVLFPLIEHLKYSRNPVLLMINHDKRFEEIESDYSHEVFDIKRGN